MKNIENYNADKYNGQEYSEVEEGIYKVNDGNEVIYVTSFSFVQEPEYDEGTYADYISQYPLEDILDKFCCYISDFYPAQNTKESEVCYQEFASSTPDKIKNLRSVIGRHVYNKEEDGRIKLIIE